MSCSIEPRDRIVSVITEQYIITWNKEFTEKEYDTFKQLLNEIEKIYISPNDEELEIDGVKYKGGVVYKGKNGYNYNSGDEVTIKRNPDYIDKKLEEILNNGT